MAAAQSDLNRINFNWLIRLRWGAVFGQGVAIYLANAIFSLSLPLIPLYSVIVVAGVTNVGLIIWLSRSPEIEVWHFATTLFLDVVLLTLLLYFSGGPFNPFNFLYLVHIALAAVVLPPGWVWGLTAFALSCFGVLFLGYRPIGDHSDHFGLHVQGMWVAFGVAAIFISYFVHRLTSALRKREEELRHARELTGRSEKLASLATLAAGAAHELSTPLSTIVVAARELERRLSGRDTEDLKLIRQEVKRCQEILRKMAPGNGQEEGEPIVYFELKDLVPESAHWLDEKVDLRLPIELKNQRVVGPKRALAQAIEGLVKNARQATKEGGAIVIDVKCLEDSVEITVQDQGIGMSSDQLAHVGEPFFTTKEPGEGLGLGLFLTKILAERIGGSLRIHSSPGNGTRASLLIPLRPAMNEAA